MTTTADNFAARAALLAARGIPVVPVAPGEKRCLLPNWPALAATDVAQIETWSQTADFNTAAVCLPDGICVLDADSAELLDRIPQPLPKTFTTRSAGKRLPHFYFLQTDRSRELGNRKAAKLFDFQQNRKYVVGPGSRLADGRTYDVIDDSTIVPIPDWLCDWIEQNSTSEKKALEKKAFGDSPPIAEDFDFDALMSHYDIGGDWDGDYFRTEVCPVAGRTHEQSHTGFYFNGQRLGFICFAASCPGSDMHVGQVIAHLNKSHRPYTKPIWAELPNMMVGGRIYASQEAYEAALAEKAAKDAEYAKSWRGLFHTKQEALDAPPTRFVIENFLQEKSITMLGGPPASMKTYAALHIAKALITGEPLFDFFPVTEQASHVLYLIPESSLSPFADRLKKLHMTDFIGETFFFRTLDATERTVKITDPRILEAAKGGDVFLDTAVRFMDGDENTAADQRAFADNLFALLNAGARTVTGLHHSPKAFERQNQMTLENILRGSGDIGAMLATCWGLAKVDANWAQIHVECVKDRDFRETPKPFVLEGRPHIDKVGKFKLLKSPGTAPSYQSVKQAARGARGGGKNKVMVTDEVRREVIELHKTGLSYRDIGNQTGLKKDKVAEIVGARYEARYEGAPRQ
jgi:hypothetical protein